MKNILAYY